VLRVIISYMDSRNNRRPIITMLANGDYDGAVNKAEELYKLSSDERALFFRVDVLCIAGKHTEAEEICRQLLTLPKLNSPQLSPLPKAIKTQALFGLGRSLLWQGKPTEAISAFQEASVLTPQVPGPYNEMATVYLQQIVRPADALQLTDKALEVSKAKRSKKDVSYTDHILANRAWALALLGDHTNAKAIIDGLLETPKLDVPTSAKFNFYAGQLALLRKDVLNALTYFNNVLLGDPKGVYTSLATTSLREISNSHTQAVE